MAGDRRDEDTEEFRNVCAPRSGNSEQTERAQLECLNSSQGALSSIRPAFKRTSRSSPSRTDNGRQRRQPEIRILSVEPLPVTSWFARSTGGLQQHPLSVSASLGQQHPCLRPDLVGKPRPSLPKPLTTSKAGGPTLDTDPPADPHRAQSQCQPATH
ncbi:uncharacterized protein LOC113582227 [Electrophorus electricus]|uniref:uncharacterized protein LOC113582227 n=1 Tax=Electrophorus electricus TaxID=8005 RepID=UPI0015D00EF5|nr:uncharacterized protein LOC113582227 [Electrophorus electricus]